MNYQVLARTWRPKKFEEIAGQQYVVKAIIHSFNLNKVHHAYILSGDRGTGKTTIARLFAKGLNCKQSITVNMCGVCQNCTDIDSGRFIDLIEIDAASRTKVEDTYEFLDSIQYIPIQGRFKVYLIDEVHMLSKHSFNALLKILEEPPKHVKFILVTTDHQKIPETVLSRCLQLHLKPLSVLQIVSKLEYICNEEKIEANTNALELLAYSAKGSMRDALNLLEQAMLLGNNSITDDIINNMLGLLHVEESLSLVENLIDRNIDNIMEQINNYSILGINWDFLFEEILTIFQKAAMYQFSLHSSLKKTNIKRIKCFEERIYNLSNRITPENIQLYYQIFLLGRRELPYSPSYRMGMEMTILRALAFYPINNQHDTDNSSVNDNTNTAYEHASKNAKSNVNLQNSADNINNTVLMPKNIIDNNIDFRKLTDNFNNSHGNTTASLSNKSNNVPVNDITSKILEARLKLLDYKKNYNQVNNDNIVNLNTNKISKKVSKNVLERFSNINMNINENHSHDIKKK